MPATPQNQNAPAELLEAATSATTVKTDKSLLERIVEIKEWIGLGIAVAAAIFSSAGWILTYFAKKAEVDTLACEMHANVRVVKDNSSIQKIEERQIQLKKELREAKRRGNGTKHQQTVSTNVNDEYESVEELKAAIQLTKENVRILADDAAFFSKSLELKECDSKETRDKLREKIRTNPQLKEDRL